MKTQVAQWSDRTVTTLSGGERARVLLARILAGESDWILADEPFTGLDPSHQFEAAELLRSIADQGGGVVLTIHDLHARREDRRSRGDSRRWPHRRRRHAAGCADAGNLA